MAREALARNIGGRIEGAPGVPSADPKKQISQYGPNVRVVNHGTSAWNFDIDTGIFPSPRSTNWGEGWVSEPVRRAMLSHHKVYQGINNLKNAIMGDGGRWIPAVNPYRKGEKEYFQEALKYATFMEFFSRQMHGSNWNTMRQMLDCVHEGNKLAPITFREQTSGRYKGFWVLDRLNVWDNRLYSFWRDEFGNFTEVHAGADYTNKNNRYPKEKFLILTYRPKNDNPYGTTILEPVYEPFYHDIQMDHEEMAYMATFGRPSVIIFAAPPPPDKIDDKEELIPLQYRDGAPVLEEDPDNPGEYRQRIGYQTEQNMLLFTEFKAGSIWSMEAGALVQVVEARAGGAEVFDNKRERNARNITGAIFGTHQVTEAERNVSTGNQEVGEGIVGLSVTEGKMMLEEAEENQLAALALELNYGAGARDLLPKRDYGSGQGGRLPKVMNAAVNFTSNQSWDKAMLWDFNAANGLPLNYPDSETLQIPVGVQLGGSGGDKTGKPAPTDPAPTDDAGAGS
jgi:uncharacterized protein YeaO (DUF488 family)